YRLYAQVVRSRFLDGPHRTAVAIVAEGSRWQLCHWPLLKGKDCLAGAAREFGYFSQGFLVNLQTNQRSFGKSSRDLQSNEEWRARAPDSTLIPRNVRASRLVSTAR